MVFRDRGGRSASAGGANGRRCNVLRARKEFNDKAAAQPHVRPIQPVRFDDAPSGDREPTLKHEHLRRAIDEMLRSVVRLTTSTVGSGCPVYYRANDTRHHLVPAGFVRHGIADHPVTSWKTWERGAPQIAFEVLDDGDPLEEMVQRYHELGVRELVVFTPDAPSGNRLHVWDRIDGDFVERLIEAEQTPSLTLEHDLAVGPVLIAGVAYEACVRLVAPRERHGKQEPTFVPTEEEAKQTADRVKRARAREREASLSEARSQRAAALARADERAARISSSNDRRLAELKRSK